MKRKGGRPLAIFVCGVPCSGKSTYIANNLRGFTVVGTDKYLDKWSLECGRPYHEIFKRRIGDACLSMVNDILEATENGEDIVIDQTNLTPASRRKKIRLISGRHNYELAAINFFICQGDQQDRLIKRKNRKIPSAVIEQMNDDYIPAKKSEGFSRVINIGLPKGRAK